MKMVYEKNPAEFDATMPEGRLTTAATSAVI
jgi:hypothetical protein